MCHSCGVLFRFGSTILAFSVQGLICRSVNFLISMGSTVAAKTSSISVDSVLERSGAELDVSSNTCLVDFPLVVLPAQI